MLGADGHLGQPVKKVNVSTRAYTWVLGNSYSSFIFFFIPSIIVFFKKIVNFYLYLYLSLILLRQNYGLFFGIEFFSSISRDAIVKTDVREHAYPIDPPKPTQKRMTTLHQNTGKLIYPQSDNFFTYDVENKSTEHTNSITATQCKRAEQAVSNPSTSW